jgi:hypothetical protein
MEGILLYGSGTLVNPYYFYYFYLFNKNDNLYLICIHFGKIKKSFN